MARRLRAPDRAQLTRPPLPEGAPAGSSGAGLLSSRPSPDGRPFARDFFRRAVADVARDLLGAIVESTVEGIRCALVVVEAEAYGGPEDPASHAATRSGVTARNRTMFGPPGRAYVYRSYGVHWCLNVVTGAEGEGAAVLLRGGVPLRGIDAMRLRRSGRMPIAAGPGRLGQALGVTGTHDGHDLAASPVRLLRGWSVEPARVGVSPRIGVSRAAERLLRFYLPGAPGVSGRPR